MIKRVKKALDKNIVHQQEVVLGWGRRVMDVGLVAPKKGYDASCSFCIPSPGRTTTGLTYRVKGYHNTPSMMIL